MVIMATSQQIASLKKEADRIQKSLNDSIASGQIKRTIKPLATPTKTNTAGAYSKESLDALGSARGDEFAPAFEASGGIQKGKSITETLDRRAGQSGGGNKAMAEALAASQKASSALKAFSMAHSPTTPAGSNAVGIKTGMGRYSRYGYEDAPVVEQPSLEQIQKKMSKDSQKEINSLYQYQSDLLQEQAGINQQNDRSTASINTLSGLAGSTEANINQQATTAKGQQANQQIMNQIQTQVQGVLSAVRKDAQQQYQFERSEARLDAETARKNKEDFYKRAQENTKLLAQSGATAEGYKATDPEGYQHLVKQLGSEELVKATFTLNRPIEQVVERKIEGGKLIQIYENPLTGKSTIETLDLGLPVGYSKTIDAGNRILAIPDNWDGEPSKLVTINKGLTPTQQAKGDGIGSAGGQYGSDLDAIIGATKATITSKFGQQTFDQQMARARDEADKINLVASVVLGKADAQTKSDFANQAVGMKQIEKAIKKLDEGTKTGFINNKAQYVYNLVGKDYDPKLAEINQLITSAIQPYRNSVTGAAWGDQEDGEYNMLFGSTKYSPTELRQRLVGVKEILASKSATALNAYVNPIGYYDNPFESGQYASGNSGLRAQVEQAGYDYDAMKADGLSDEAIRASL